MMSAVRGYMAAEQGRQGLILCGREFMNSLEDSSMNEVKQAIASVPWLAAYYEVGEQYIRTRNRRVSYSFTGLRHNLDSLKGKAPILLSWVDEAENVSEAAWVKLGPTVREPGSEIWVTWNPERNGSPTDLRYRKHTAPSAKIAELNYSDNPWFPPELEDERLADRERLDDATYAWVWEGRYRQNSKAQILAGKYVVREFTPAPGWDGPYYGIDWGFSQDPTVGVKLWVHDRRLYVEYEAGKVGLENDDIAKFMIERLPGIERHTIRADSARPETISHAKSDGGGRRQALPKIIPVEKWKGSVEDGIAHLRGYIEIVVHPRCTGFVNEARLYSYKVDRLSGDVLTDIVDAHNHYIDASRYALGPMIRRQGAGFM
jgi:phage terminase large subunit